MKIKTLKLIAIVGIIGLVIALGVVYYIFNMPHRDVQAAKIDFSMSSTQIVNEYLTNADAANEKYLQEEGDSKILAVTGKIYAISEDLNNQKVILLKDSSENAGVSCTFTKETNNNAEDLKVGQTITIKGVIRSGAGFDEDLDMYENVIMEKCDVVKQ